jgi:DNA polymerase III subunit delta
MTALSEDRLEAFLSRSLPAFSGLLVYGDDPSAADDVARQAIAKIGNGSAAEGVLRLEARDVNASQGALLDAVQAMSLLGGRQVIVVSGVTDTVLKSVQPVLDQGGTGNFVILLAGSLNKSSKLRQAIEQSASFAALPLYEAKLKDLEQRLAGILSANNLKITAEAKARFFELVGNDRMIMSAEAEKLCLYAFGSAEISLADVEASCGAVSEAEISRLIDAVCDGNLVEVERHMMASEDDGSGIKSALPLLSYHLSQLQALQLDRAGGKSVEQALASARPPVHFSRKAVIGRQLQQIDSALIEKLMALVEEATFASRRTSALSNAIIGRLFLSVAREVRFASRSA